MLTSITDIESARAPNNLKKLCRHFGHKVETSFDDEHGTIRFPFADISLTAEDNTLRMQIRAENEEDLARAEQVVTDHLLRFAYKEDLQVAWQRAA